MQWHFNVLKGDSLTTFENSKRNFNNHQIVGFNEIPIKVLLVLQFSKTKKYQFASRNCNIAKDF